MHTVKGKTVLCRGSNQRDPEYVSVQGQRRSEEPDKAKRL